MFLLEDSSEELASHHHLLELAQIGLATKNCYLLFVILQHGFLHLFEANLRLIKLQ